MGRRIRSSTVHYEPEIDLAFNPAEPRDTKGRWTPGELHALTTWVKARGGVRRIQHGALAEDFNSALAKLPESNGDLWRGVRGSGADRHAMLNPGDTVHWDAPRSASVDQKQAFSFGTNLYRIQGSHGRVVAGEGLPNAYEKEAILPAGDYEVVSRDDAAKVGQWPVSVVTLRPKYRALDLARPERTAVHVNPRRTAVDEDGVVREIATLLRVGYRYQRLSTDFGWEVDGISKLLAPWGIREQSVRMALGLTHQEGGGRRGTAHSPNARLAENGAVLDDTVRDVRDSDVYFRAAYIANAALRMQRAIDNGASPTAALSAERPHYLAHENARRGRLKAVAQVQVASKLYGPVVGWYLNPLKNNEAECIAANGHNFYAEQGTVIGLPGSVHNQCGCYAGPPWEGAGMVNDVFANLRALRPTGSTAKFRLKEAKGA